MKLISIPQEYEAIRFNGITEEVNEFLLESNDKVYKNDGYFILSNAIGNHRVNIGDYLYKMNSQLKTIGVIHADSITSKYFKVVEWK